METYVAVMSTIGALSGALAAFGVFIVNAKLDRLTGRVAEQGETLRAHVNHA